MPDYRPDGFRDLTAYFVVEGASDFIAFLTAAFGARELDRHLADDGRLMHSAVQVGDCMIEVSDSNATYGAVRFNMHFYVKDVDATHLRAIACGATGISMPQDMPYGERGSGVVDKWGNTWWLATSLGHQTGSAAG